MSIHGNCDRCNAQDVELFLCAADDGCFCGDCVDILMAQEDARQAEMEMEEGYIYDEPEDHFRDDVEADADVLRSAGMGTDEDYGYYGDYDGMDYDFGMDG